MANSHLKYKSLNSDEIRLLSLHPCSAGYDIKCTLQNAKLQERPKYEALSYMWGSDNNLKSIQIDGEMCQVRENLWEALRRLVLWVKPRVLWVDALCINQEDNIERNHQVAQMGMISRQAERVCVWLGPAEPWVARPTFNFLEIPVLLERDEDLLRFSRFCGLEYWTRLWIIQEVVLAAEIRVYWGNAILPWETLSSTFFALRRGYYREPSGFPDPFPGMINKSIILRLCEQRKQIGRISVAKEEPLLHLLDIYAGARCSDVRDKIFGLHSLASPCCRTANPVDYTCSGYALCGRLMEHFFHHHSSHEAHAYIIEISQRLHGLLMKGARSQSKTQNDFQFGGPECYDQEDKVISKVKNSGPIKVRGYAAGSIRFVTSPSEARHTQKR